MNDETVSFDEFDMGELSEEDLAVIKAFEAMDVWLPELSSSQKNDQNRLLEVPQVCSPQQDEEMHLIFATEAEADIQSIHQVLNLLAQDEPENLNVLITLKRAGHKLHGAAGAVGFPLISTVANQVELLAEGVLRSAISVHIGIEAIAAATTVLEACLQVITSASEELEAPSLLASLEAVYQSLGIDLQQIEWERAESVQIDTSTEKLLPPTSPLPVDVQQFEDLAVSTEQLVAPTVEDAHRSVYCFLVRVGEQHFLIPFNQIQRISNEQQEQANVCYSLQELLGFPAAASTQSIVKPQASTCQHFQLLCSEDETMEGKHTAIVVDEVLGEQEALVEPLPAYLQRPGIAGTTIDSSGLVLLVVNPLELIRLSSRLLTESEGERAG